MSFAKATIVGRLGGDPETKYLESGTMVVSFSMAADGRKKDAGPTWFRVSAFGEQAERIATMIERGYIKKGALLYVEGRLESREYQANGQNRTSLDVNLSDWQFVGGNQQDGQQQQGNVRQFPNQGGGNMNQVPF